MPRPISVDFTDVKSGGGAPGVHIPEGDYVLKVVKVEQKTGGDSGEPYLDFSLKVTKGDPKGVGKTLRHVCTLQKKGLWNLKNLIEATGKKVPEKALKLDLDKMIGWELAGTVIDDEYNGKTKSVVSATFPVTEWTQMTPSETLEAAGKTKETAEVLGVDEDDEAEELFE